MGSAASAASDAGRRGRLPTADAASPLTTGKRSAVLALFEPWHSLALSCLHTTRLKAFQTLLSSFVPLMMSVDMDYAEAVMAQHFYTLTRRTRRSVHPPEPGTDDGAGAPRGPPADATGGGGEPAPSIGAALVEPLTTFQEVVRSFLILCPDLFVRLIGKYLAQPSTLHPALLMLHHLASSSTDRALSKLGAACPDSPIVVRLSKVLAAAVPDDETAALLSCWTITIVLPYSVSALLPHVNDTLAAVVTVLEHLAAAPATAPPVSSSAATDAVVTASTAAGTPATPPVAPRTNSVTAVLDVTDMPLMTCVVVLVRMLYGLFPSHVIQALQVACVDAWRAGRPSPKPIIWRIMHNAPFARGLLQERSWETHPDKWARVDVIEIIRRALHAMEDTLQADGLVPSAALIAGAASFENAGLGGAAPGAGAAPAAGDDADAASLASLVHAPAPPALTAADDAVAHHLVGDHRTARQSLVQPQQHPQPPSSVSSSAAAKSGSPSFAAAMAVRRAHSHAAAASAGSAAAPGANLPIVAAPCVGGGDSPSFTSAPRHKLSRALLRQEIRFHIHLRRQISRCWRYIQGQYIRVLHEVDKVAVYKRLLADAAEVREELTNKCARLETKLSSAARERAQWQFQMQEKFQRFAEDRRKFGSDVIMYQTQATAAIARYEEVQEQLTDTCTALEQVRVELDALRPQAARAVAAEADAVQWRREMLRWQALAYARTQGAAATAATGAGAGTGTGTGTVPHPSPNPTPPLPPGVPPTASAYPGPMPSPSPPLMGSPNLDTELAEAKQQLAQLVHENRALRKALKAQRVSHEAQHNELKSRYEYQRALLEKAQAGTQALTPRPTPATA